MTIKSEMAVEGMFVSARRFPPISEQNFVMEHFLVATISEVHFEVMEQLNPNRVAKNRNGMLL